MVQPPRPPGSHTDPAPLGLAAFALTTFLLSTVNAGWLPDTVEPVVFGLALAYGGLGQFAAGSARPPSAPTRGSGCRSGG